MTPTLPSNRPRFPGPGCGLRRRSRFHFRFGPGFGLAAWGAWLLVLAAGGATAPVTPPSERAPAIPVPMEGHPGNVHVEGEEVGVAWPAGLSAAALPWRLLDDRQRTVRTGDVQAVSARRGDRLPLGRLGPGWYRVEFDAAPGTNAVPGTAGKAGAASAWTTLAVLPRLRAPVPGDTPVAVDSAAAWFARGDAAQQERLARLAALAGVGWVRDRLRWADLQPEEGPLVARPTTYDTSADVHAASGLGVLQVFHDTPAWAREAGQGGGRFAPDLRRVHALGRRLAERFRGRVAAWEPWNEANAGTFGGHTVDQMCSWQKAAWLGFKAGDPGVTVGWNPTAAVPTPAHTEGILANETWPYFDTYNIHTYDWAHGYPELWKPAREAAAGRPIWITEADRGTPHLKNPPWYDQDPRLERLKAEWMAQSYASSLFSGARRHFHFILGNYQEPNGVQFGLLRLDLTPRPAYVALAAVGRWLAGARPLGRWLPGRDVQVYAFEARPDGAPADVLVAWTEKEADWDGRGKAEAAFQLPRGLAVLEVADYLGRPLGTRIPETLGSAPVFIRLAPGQSAKLPLAAPPVLAERREGVPSPVVLQLSLPRTAVRKVEDLPWSEGHAYRAAPGEPFELLLHAYNFASDPVSGRLVVERVPPGWSVDWERPDFQVTPGDRAGVKGRLHLPAGAGAGDGWVVIRAGCGTAGRPVVAFRVLVEPRPADRDRALDAGRARAFPTAPRRGTAVSAGNGSGRRGPAA